MRESTRARSCRLSLTCSSSQSSDYSSDAVDVNVDVKMQHVPSGNPMTVGDLRTGPVSSQMNPSSSLLLTVFQYNSNPFGSNPTGTNPFGSNPTGTNPFGSNPTGTNPFGTNPTG